MSNDIIVSLKNQIASVQTGLDDDTRAVAGGSTGGMKRISIKAACSARWQVVRKLLLSKIGT